MCKLLRKYINFYVFTKDSYLMYTNYNELNYSSKFFFFKPMKPFYLK